jgi:hypothetical protein
MIGCCAHHAHADEPESHANCEIGGPEASAHVSFFVPTECSCTGESHSGQPSQSCGESSCVSVKPTNDFRFEFSTVADLQIVLLSAEGDVSPSFGERFATHAMPFAPPLGLYLLHHAFLI